MDMSAVQMWGNITSAVAASCSWQYQNLLNKSFLVLRCSVPLMMVVGGPIPVKQTSPDDPNFAAAVDEAHGKLVEAMQQLYDKYKGEYGWADRPLIIK